jgi:hypothetical protein
MLTDQVGDAVYIRANMNGNYKVARVDVTLTAKIPAIGIIVRKWGFTDALVQRTGEIKNVFTGLSAGRPYFVGGDGKPNLSPPVAAPGGRAYVQPIGVALDATVLLVDPSKNLTILVG